MLRSSNQYHLNNMYTSAGGRMHNFTIRRYRAINKQTNYSTARNVLTRGTVTFALPKKCLQLVGSTFRRKGTNELGQTRLIIA